MKIDNSWLSNRLPNKFIEREMTALLLPELNKPEVTIVYGPRQVGKSTEIIKCLQLWLKDNPELEIFYHNLDYITSDFDNPEKFLNILLQQKNGDGRAVLVLDEAQRLPNLGLFIKYIYDQNPPFKIILSGSASLEIKQKIREPLTGRKREFFMSPLSSMEILRFRGIDVEKLKVKTALTEEVLNDLMIYGGYPGAQFLGEADRINKLTEIATSYLFKDLGELFGLKDESAIRIVAVYLAENIGNLLNMNNLSRLSGVSKREIEKISEALEKMYVIRLVKPFSGSKTKEFVHASKIYFYDNGFRNAILGKLDRTRVVADKGKLFENLIFTGLVNRYGEINVQFWRTRNGTEIDFVVQENNKIRLFECKYLKKTLKSGAMESFAEQYGSRVVSKTMVDSGNYWIL